MDLVRWQTWAPDPERAYMLWTRLLGWLAGPCLVLAMLSFAFPGPRQGRGQALGAGLVAGRAGSGPVAASRPCFCSCRSPSSACAG